MYFYKAYELSIQSDAALHGLQPIESCQPDIIMQRSTTLPTIPDEAIHIRNAHGLPNRLWISQNPEIGQYYIENGQRILYNIDDTKLQFPLHIFLMGSCFGAILQQRGYIVLHANTVKYSNQSAISFLGNQGAGKSTTSAWHLTQGAQFVADDITAIKIVGRQAMVIPGFQRLKLWQDSMEGLGLSSDHPIYQQGGRTKFHITINDSQFVNGATPLSDINILDKNLSARRQLSGINAVQQLFQQSYRKYFIRAMGIAHSYHHQLMQLGECTKIYQTPRPFSLEVLQETII